MLMVLEIAPEMNGCAAAIMRMWLSTETARVADAAARVGAVEHRQMLSLQMGRAFEGHRAADIGFAASISALAKPERLQHVEVRRSSWAASIFSVSAEGLAQRPLVEDEADVEGRFEGAFDLVELFRVEAAAVSASW